jgi:hypothetical protein
MDRGMFHLSASYGFLHFSEFVTFFPNGGEQLKESVIRDWELKMLTPRMEKAEKYLSFLFPIPMRIERLETITRVMEES